MKHKLLLPIVVAGFAPLAVIHAQPAEGDTEGPKPPRSPIVSALDKDGDRALDAQEIAGAPEALAALDKNGDGQLTREELKPSKPAGSGQKPARPPGVQPPPHRAKGPLLQALDKNADKVIDKSEIAGAPESLATLDKDGDGQISREELAPPRPPGAPDRRKTGGASDAEGEGPQPPPEDN